MGSHRIQKIESVIKEALGSIILNELNDPRIPDLFSITRVKVTADVSLAKVYFSIMDLTNNSDNVQKVSKAIEHSIGFIKRKLAKKVYLRHLPELKFYYDDGLVKGSKVLTLLNKISHENDT